LRAGCRPNPQDGAPHNRSSQTTRAQSALRSRTFLTGSILVDDAGGERHALGQFLERLAL
jgi:hypothetical protein